MESLVSVVIPCYCCSQTLKRAVDSVAFQTKRPYEVILVEDCSPDEGRTKESLYEMQKIYGNQWIKVIALEKNVGAAGARNIGWKNASGKYLAFLDADDSWHPYKVEAQLSIMEKENIDFSAHLFKLKANTCITDTSQDIGNIKEDINFNEISRTKLLLSNKIPTSSVMMKRDISIVFDHSKRYSEDYLLWLSILFHDYKGVFIHYPLGFCYKTIYGGGLSSRLWEMEKGELDTYYRLYAMKKINKFSQVIFSIVSLLKFIIRAVRR